MEEIIQIARDCYNEAESNLKDLMTEMWTDTEYVLGNQWKEEDINKLIEEGRPPLTINVLHKIIATISGMEKQNRADIRFFPQEGSDEKIVYPWTQLVKWILSNAGADIKRSYAFEDMLRSGIGYIVPEVRYDKDPINGDIVLTTESPFNILFDPHITEPTGEDAEYMIRHKRVIKSRLKLAYPEMRKKIDDLATSGQERFVINKQDIRNERDQYVNVVEFWRREYEEKEFMIKDGMFVEFGGDSEMRDMLKSDGMDFIKRSVPTIKLTIIADWEIILYDGDHPHGVDMYPFIPIFCYFTPSYDKWELKIQGMARQLRDIQNEKNKRRSQMLHQTNTSTRGGWMFEEGAVEDLSTFEQSAGSGVVIQYRYGKKPDRIEPPRTDSGMIQAEQMNDNDLLMAGPNPDLLGYSNDKGAPGITVRLRQKQGVAYLQGVFDNHSESNKHLARYVQKLAMENFGQAKIQRILGSEVILPPDFMERSREIRYDATIDESFSSPTNRIAMLESMKQMQQYGIPVPPQMFVDMWDLSPELKKKYSDMLAQANQQEMQKTQMRGGSGQPPTTPPTGIQM